MPLAVFDLDETLISGDSATLWLQWLVERQLTDPSLLAEEAKLMERYSTGVMRMEDYMSLTLQPLAGRTHEEVAGWVQDFIAERIEPRIYPDARDCLADYRGRDWTLLIISATAEHLVLPIARHLGVEHALGIGLEMTNGRYSGQTRGVLSYRDGKVQRLREWLNTHALSLTGSHAYSDSINDLPLLMAADVAHAVNPCERLATEAKNRGWNFRRWALSALPVANA